MTFLKPMLAATIEDVSALRLPLVASPKLDGIRCLLQGGRALSRTGKPIPNEAVRAFLEGVPALEGCDGELMVHGQAFSSISSTFMGRRSPLPRGWYYAVFDVMPERAGEPYSSRLERLTALVASLPATVSQHVVLTPQVQIATLQELEAFETKVLDQGFEGVMLRRAQAPYKHGRVTLNEASLMKLKRFTDAEAEIIGFQALVRETGQVCELLGALVVRDLESGIEFEIGTGYTPDVRASFWQNQKTLMGAYVKYKHFEHGAKTKPRFPVFLGLRATEDMG